MLDFQMVIAAAIALNSRLAPVVFSQALRILNDRAEAEDVTQESLLRLWKAAPKWKANKAKITTWLYRVTFNLCIDHLRKSNRNSGDVQQEVVDDTPDVECNLQNKERLQALRRAGDPAGSAKASGHFASHCRPAEPRYF